MDTGVKILLGAGAAYGIYKLIDISRLSAAGEALEIEPAGATFGTWSGGLLGHLPGWLTFEALNPTTKSIRLDFVSLKVFTDKGDILGKFDNISEPVVFKGRTKTTFAIPFRIPAGAVGSYLIKNGIAALLKGEKLKLPEFLKVAGTTAASGFTLPYEKLIPVTPKQVPPVPAAA